MKIDGSLAKTPLDTATNARALEAAGYDGIWIGETDHDPFLLALRAADGTETADIATAVAIAFARTPMTLANVAFDLALYTK